MPAPPPSRSLQQTDYTMGWICALSTELGVAQLMLDEEHNPPLSAPPDDNNVYTYGSIGPHNVVLACLPAGVLGNSSAATVAMDLVRSFGSIKLGLLVGIGGGIPTELDIRLGDVVVSTPDGTHGGVVQYDLGKTVEGGRFVRRGVLDKPHPILLSAISQVQAKHKRGEPTFYGYISEAVKRCPNFAPPKERSDVLFEAAYDHQSGEKTCDKCDPARVVSRADRPSKDPQIYYGNIASGNQVMKHGSTRDRLAREEKVICLEMEAAGLMNRLPCTVIRGISDYADSHKNDDWQSYAALAAAAFAKELLLRIPPKEVKKVPSVDQAEDAGPIVPLKNPLKNLHWLVFRKSSALFTGRENVLKRLEDCLIPSTEDRGSSKQRRVVCVGIGGAGKSEICLKFAENCRDKFWGVFWIDAGSEENIKRDFVQIGDHCSIPDRSLTGVLTWLSSVTEPWLLIFVNADNPNLDYGRYFPSCNRGCILLTTQEEEYSAYNTAGCERIESLEEEDSITLLLKTIGAQRDSWEGKRRVAAKVVKELNSHVLAIVQAGAFVREKYCTLEQYPDLLAHHRPQLLSPSEHTTNGGVYMTLEVTAKMLEASSKPEAAHALDLIHAFAFLDSEDIAESIFHKAWSYARKRKASVTNEPDRELFLSDWHMSHAQSFLDQKSTTFDSSHFRRACDLLVSLSLLRKDENTQAGAPKSQAVLVHPLVQAWARQRMDVSGRKQVWVRTGSILALATEERRLDYRFRRNLPHIEAFLEHRPLSYLEDSSKMEVIQMLYRLIWTLNALRASYPLVRVVREVFDAAREGVLQCGSGSLLSLQCLCACCHLEDGNHEDGMSLLKEALEARKMSGPKHPDRLAEVRELIKIYRGMTQFDEARKLLKDIDKAHHIPLDPKRLKSHQDLADTHTSRGEFEDAVKLLKGVFAYQKSEMKLSTEDPDRLISQHRLAKAYTGKGEPKEGIKLLREVVKMEKELPEEDLDRLASQHELALAYSRDGQFDKAAKLLEKIVEVDKKLLPRHDPDRLASQVELATVYKALGKHSKALKLLKAVVKDQETALPADDPLRLVRMEDLAHSYLCTEQAGEAIPLLEEVVRIRESTLTADDSDLFRAKQMLAGAVRIRDSTLPADDSDLLGAKEMLAEVPPKLQGKPKGKKSSSRRSESSRRESSKRPEGTRSKTAPSFLGPT